MIHNVQQLATVKLNGRDLGLAYRLRYTMAVGDTLREGKTELEIQVTNTWLNRMVTVLSNVNRNDHKPRCFRRLRHR